MNPHSDLARRENIDGAERLFGPVLRLVVRGAVLTLTLMLALMLAAAGAASAQSRFDVRARAYMLEHCMEETAKRIEPGSMITVTLASGAVLRGSFVRASAETLVVYPYGLLKPVADPLTIQKPLIKSLRFENKPYASNTIGVLGLVTGAVAGVGVAALAIGVGEREVDWGYWPILLGAEIVGAVVGFEWGRNLTKDNPGESLIQCQ